MLPDTTINVDRPDPGTAVVAVIGQCDVYAAPELRSMLTGLVNEGRYRQIIDLRDVTLLDSSGLSVIVGAAKRALAHGGKLVLVVDLESRPGKALRVTGLHKAIPNAPTTNKALDLLPPHELEPVPVLARAVMEVDAPKPSFWPPQVGDVWMAGITSDVPQPWTCSGPDELRSSGFPQSAQWVWDTYGPLKLVWRGGAVVTAMHSSELSA